MMRALIVLAALAGSIFAAEELPITGVAHACFKSSDLEKTRAYYVGVLGFHEAFDVKDAAGKVTAAFFKINDEQYVEITPNLAAGEIIRFDHVAFSTPDAAKLRGMLEARGLSPTKIEKAPDGARMFGLSDPENNRLEFVQDTPGSLESKARGKYLDGRISEHMYHAGLVITDLDKALAFYGGKLGFAEFWHGGPTPKPIWFNLRTPGSRGDYVELMLASDTPSRDEYGQMQHICLEVPDIQAGLKTALARGHYDEKKLDMHIGRNRKWQLNLFDPDGTRTELMEPKAQAQ
jgi:catechol 2,3-dioxygenase-like lactoylglutathione lyase family enzyme